VATSSRWVCIGTPGRVVEIFECLPADAVQARTPTHNSIGPTGFLPVGPMFFLDKILKSAKPADKLIKKGKAKN
jgi:hypothetical protein